MHKTKEKRKKQWLNESKSKGKQINWKKLKAWLNVQWNLKNLSLKEFEKGGVTRGSQRVPSDNSAERIQGYRTAQQNPG